MSSVDDIIPDLAEAVVQFMERLPSTIGPEILVFVSLYGLDDDTSISDASTFMPKIKDALGKTGGLKRMSTTLRVISALDYILQRAVDKSSDSPAFTKMLAETRPDLAARISARQPLASKHYQAALVAWKNLRTNLLTYANLSHYEDNLLMPRRLQRDKES